ncbi:MAG: LPS export ABC transporter periplasmic protein LptC [Desulfobulbaceae bacterium]
MLHNPRNLLWLLPLLLFLTSPLWKPELTSFLRPRGGHGVPEINLDDSAEQQRFVMDAVKITMSSAGRVEWEITAEQAFTGESDKDIGLVGVDALYTGADQETTRITSVKGRYDIGESHLTLKEDVVVDKPLSRQKLLTDLLHYYNDRKVVFCPGKVELLGPDFRVRGGSLHYDLVSRGYDFGDRVRVELGI